MKHSSTAPSSESSSARRLRSVRSRCVSRAESERRSFGVLVICLMRFVCQAGSRRTRKTCSSRVRYRSREVRGIPTELLTSVLFSGARTREESEASTAGTAAKQSAEHRGREVRARRLELELTAFGPFTEGLKDPEEEKKVRAELIERIFVGDPGQNTGSAALT